MSDDPHLVLEPEQLSTASATRLPRRVLGRWVLTLLVLLRIYVLIALPLVAYAFIRALHTGQP